MYCKDDSNRSVLLLFQRKENCVLLHYFFHCTLLFRRSIHPNTVRNRLKAAQLKARRPNVGQILTPRHGRTRMQWARVHARFTRQKWRNVIFTDESRIKLSRADGRKHVWRRRNERYTYACTIVVDRLSGLPSFLGWHYRTEQNTTGDIPR